MLVHIGSLVIFAIVVLAIPALGIGLLLRRDPAFRLKRDAEAHGARRMPSLGGALVRLQPQDYWYGVLNLVLQLAALFVYVWAVGSGQLGLFTTVEIAIFIVVILAGLGYARRAGNVTDARSQYRSS